MDCVLSTLMAHGGEYEGGVSAGLAEGVGKLSWSDALSPLRGAARYYQGQFSKGLKHGEGEYVFASGDRYFGTFENDYKHGTGVQHYIGGSVFKGDFVAGQPNGRGEHVFPSGMKYVGNFLNGLLHGEGDCTLSDLSTYRGSFLHGLRHGHGVFRWADGDVYDGQYFNDRRHGKGVYTWADGRRYEGHFENDRRQGNGTTHFPNGDRFTGQYDNDIRDGLGTLYYADGTCDHGVWRGDRLARLVTCDDPSMTSGPLNTATRGLLAAAQNNDVATFKRLHRAGLVDLNARDDCGRSGLFLSCSNGHEALVDYILSEDSDVNLLTENGVSCLLAAYRLSRSLSVSLGNQLTLEPQAKISAIALTNVCHKLLQHGSDCNKHGCSEPVLMTAVTINDACSASLFLKHGANVNYMNADGVSVLVQAAMNLAAACRSSSQSQQSNQLDQSTKRVTIGSRARKGQSLSAPATPATGPYTSTSGLDSSPTNQPQMSQELLMIKTLLEAGADPNIGSSASRHSCLHVLAPLSHPEAVEAFGILVEKGADVNALCLGMTPLALTIIHGNDKATARLLKANADTNTILSGGCNVLTLLVSVKYETVRSQAARFELVQRLLALSTDTLLNYPIKFKDESLVGIIIDSMYQDYVINSTLYGINPAMISLSDKAIQSGRNDIFHIIVDHVRKCNHDRPASERLRLCEECGRTLGVTLTPCGRCGTVYFCSEKCKMRAFGTHHRKTCKSSYSSNEGLTPSLKWRPNSVRSDTVAREVLLYNTRPSTVDSAFPSSNLHSRLTTPATPSTTQRQGLSLASIPSSSTFLTLQDDDSALDEVNKALAARTQQYAAQYTPPQIRHMSTSRKSPHAPQLKPHEQHEMTQLRQTPATAPSPKPQTSLPAIKSTQQLPQHSRASPTRAQQANSSISPNPPHLVTVHQPATPGAATSRRPRTAQLDRKPKQAQDFFS